MASTIPVTKTTMTKISGRCLCDGILFSFDSKIGQILLCHCSQCRRSSGAPFVPYVALQRQSLVNSINGGEKKAGEMVKNPLLGSITLSTWATRNFCINCGSLICMDYHAPNTLWIPLGILDDEVAEEVTNHVDVERDSQIFAESKVPWTASLQTSLPLLSSFGTYKADVCGPIKFDELPSWQENEVQQKNV